MRTYCAGKMPDAGNPVVQTKIACVFRHCGCRRPRDPGDLRWPSVVDALHDWFMMRRPGRCANTGQEFSHGSKGEFRHGRKNQIYHARQPAFRHQRNRGARYYWQPAAKANRRL